MRIDILKLEKLKKNSEKYKLNVKVINSKMERNKDLKILYCILTSIF